MRVSAFLVLGCVGAVFAPARLSAQSVGVPISPGQTLMATQLNQMQSTKVDAKNGTATNLKVQNGVIDPASTIAGVPASRMVSTDAGGNVTLGGSLTTPGGTISGPARGDRLGLAQSQYAAPNPVLHGTVTIEAPQPTLNLRSISGAAAAAFWLDFGLNVNISTNNSGARVKLLTMNGALELDDSTGSAAIFLMPDAASGSGVLVPIQADSSGGLSFGNSTTPAIALNGNTVRIGNVFDTNAAHCGSVAGSTGCIPVTTSSGTAGYIPFIPQ